MIMNNFRGMPCVRALLVALVFLFVFGAVVPGGAWARVEMQNGHEGDPEDGFDIVGGGSGDQGDSDEARPFGGFTWDKDTNLGLIEVDWLVLKDGSLVPVFGFCTYMSNDCNVLWFQSVNSVRRAK